MVICSNPDLGLGSHPKYVWPLPWLLSIPRHSLFRNLGIPVFSLCCCSYAPERDAKGHVRPIFGSGSIGNFCAAVFTPLVVPLERGILPPPDSLYPLYGGL